MKVLERVSFNVPALIGVPGEVKRSRLSACTALCRAFSNAFAVVLQGRQIDDEAVFDVAFEQALVGLVVIARRFLGGNVDVWSFVADDGSVTILDPTDSAILTLSSPEALVEAALKGVGVAQVAVHLAWEHLRSGNLKVVMHHQHHPGNYEMVIQYPHRALIAPRVRVVVDYLLEAFAADPALHVPLESLVAYRA